MSGSNCCFFTHIQVSQGKGKVIWYSHLFKNFRVCLIQIVKGFHVVKKAVDIFLELSCFLHGRTNVGNLISVISVLKTEIEGPGPRLSDILVSEMSASLPF